MEKDFLYIIVNNYMFKILLKIEEKATLILLSEAKPDN